MKALPVLLLSAAVCFSAGCLVRSIHPWLPDETRVSEPVLSGSWQDADEKTTFSFAGEPPEYQVLMTQAGKEAGHFTAALYRLDDTLLLVAGPADPAGQDGLALLPAYILLKAVPEDDLLRLYNVDLDSFGERAAAAQVPLVAGGSSSDGYVLAGTSADAETFLRAQLAAPDFFAAEPLYTLRKQPAGAP